MEKFITEQEIKIVKDFGKIWNEFLSLENISQSDKNEFCSIIHAGQNLIMARGMQKYIISLE